MYRERTQERIHSRSDTAAAIDENALRLVSAETFGRWTHTCAGGRRVKLPGPCCTFTLPGMRPRYGRPGRIPGSVNVPAATLQDPATFALRPPAQVESIFKGVGADKSKRILIYCGGGIAATMDAFLLHQLGYNNLAIYDASMSEWAKDPSLPIEVD